MAETQKYIHKVSFYEIDELDALKGKAMEGYLKAREKAKESGLVVKKATVYQDLLGLEYVFEFELAKPNPFAFMSNEKDYISEDDFYQMLKKF